MSIILIKTFCLHTGSGAGRAAAIRVWLGAEPGSGAGLALERVWMDEHVHTEQLLPANVCHCLPLEKRLRIQHTPASGGAFSTRAGLTPVISLRSGIKVAGSQQEEFCSSSHFTPFTPPLPPPQVCLLIIFRFYFHQE